MEYSPEQLLEFWKKGKSLDEATWYYTDYKIWENWRKYENTDLNKDRDNQTPPKNLAEILGDFAKKNAEREQYLRQKENAIDELWDNLFQKIFRGSLIAIGYEAPVKLEDKPKVILPHFWPPDNTDTYKSSISVHGYNFFKVQIIKKSALLKLSKNKLPKKPTITDNARGRPSQEADLLATFDWMVKNGWISTSKNLVSHMTAFNDALKIVNPNSPYINRLNYKTVNRHLGDKFNVLKQSQK